MFTDASDRRLDASRSFLHIMAENQEGQIEAIDNLIKKSQLRHIAFEREHTLVNSDNRLTATILPARVSRRLQCFAQDLCWVLDHLPNFEPHEAEELNTLHDLRDDAVQGEWLPSPENHNVLGYFITLPVEAALLFIVPRLLNFVIDTRNEMAFPGQIPEYNRETVRKGEYDGVHIDGAEMISWENFDIKCGIYNEDNAELWTAWAL